MEEKESGLKRFNLLFPEALLEDLKARARRQGTTVVELVRRFVRLGLVITTVIENDPDAVIVVRNKRTGNERELVIV